MESNLGVVRPVLADVSESLVSRRNEVNQASPNDGIQPEAAELAVDRIAEAEQVAAEEQSQAADEQSPAGDLTDAIETVSSFIEPQIRNVNFTQDDSSGQTVIKVFDAQSRELIKQFPSDEILELAERIKGLQDEVVDRTGILIDDKV
ncbi:flagellar protein FlaG [Thalassotalea euphylliae]|uniref:Flagellar protein FlaG n=1 Tax=Thalassotalea euphylliae TaxID=1655234 RepID=A0A3E0U047_9GAMM|nr:flagellar protein FlaG [Thalassotalea euphylliae]REL30288.1 hypothetical protein DXX94_05965 [Thalassotalea euphylliae]